jgi:hypothetical protein
VGGMIEFAVGSGPVFKNVGSGDGIIPIHGSDADEQVCCMGAPAALRVPDSEWMSRLSLVVEYIETVARFDPARLAIRAQCRTTIQLEGDRWTQPFDLRVLPDGSRRLAVGPSTGEILTVDSVPTYEWERLQADLRRIVENEEWKHPAADEDWLERKLCIRLDTGSLEFAETRDADRSSFSADVRKIHVRGLRAWALVRGAMECPDCTDQRPQDQAWIDGR